MQIDDVAGKKQLVYVGLGLTRAEAAELRDTLEALLNDPTERHEHVSSADYKIELIVWIQQAGGSAG